MQLHLLLMLAVVRLSTQSAELPHLAITKVIPQNIYNNKQFQLLLTNPSNLFTSLKPAETIQIPIFPHVDQFWQSLLGLNESSNSVASTIAPPAVTESPISPPTTPGLVRIPATTRPPGVPHHFTDDNIVQSEFFDGVLKIKSDREQFELRYTNHQKSTEAPLESSKETLEPTQAPPLIRSFGDKMVGRSLWSDIGLPEIDRPLTYLRQPSVPIEPFLNSPLLVSSIETLPFEDTKVSAFAV